MGKTIKIYLPDESVAGIRHAEIANWSGQALACPRSRFQELREWPEVQRPGVYFLLGVDDATGSDAVYIGEAEVVIDRLASHVTGKDFWTEVVAFTSKDENLTKAHVRYLESRLVEIAKQAGRYQVTNFASPQLPSLPRSDRDAMEEFLGAAKMLLGALGHKVLENLVLRPKRSNSLDQTPAVESLVDANIGSVAVEQKPYGPAVFHLRVAGIHARSMRTDEGMVVLEGSDANATTYKSLTSSMAALRQVLIESGTLAVSKAKLRVTRDHLFKSPSQAAGILAGYSINGRECWKLEDGTTYAQFETQQSNLLLEDPAPKERSGTA
ncbi:GIY-YIG nuclease family protein [Telluria mixta]|uniref:GIY-YIG nuclease family protein n=1 Tax=Telluria mixta TaxID=34071 RepID=A0ABT2C2P5_9BURK|nr:GIY-YIG nuclease family protein [Telluria mixta]MCS0631662.1 GIY-YIG nuclease family protein [Telluria mixta]WEM98412.1 GIY-YIG nuclease family protein [Telluria mixta]